jgi:hypothetical protein
VRQKRRPNRLVLAGTLAALVLAGGSTVGLAAASGAFGGDRGTGTRAPTGRAATATAAPPRRWPARWSTSA